MRYENVSVAAVVHVDAPVRLSSAELMGRLQSTLERLDVRPGLLEEVAGIRERRIWGRPTPVAEAAALAGREGDRAVGRSPYEHRPVGQHVGVPRLHRALDRRGRARSLGLPDTCQNFDLGNACLAFLNGMDVAAYMIERGDIEYALIVDGEVSDQVTRRTVARLNRPETTAEQFRAEFASLTLGSGAVAVVLGRGDWFRTDTATSAV